MISSNLKSLLTRAALGASVLLAGGASFAQQQINLTAAAATAVMPDGTPVQMWGYSCGAPVTGSTATCTALNPAVALGTAAGTWSPVVITLPSGQDLQISLTNSLPSGIPTSLVIVGQLGGGLGSVGAGCTGGGATCTPSPTHSPLGVSWSTVNTPGGTNPTFTPPPQGTRVQSFGAEVAPGATASLCWGTSCTPSAALQPGTYLIESGTHPSIQGPMGLYGILVVTTAPSGATAGTAYPATANSSIVTYNSEIPLLFSEIDPVQNAAVALAVTQSGFSETTVWSAQPGGCADPATHAIPNCYPPAVDYSPLYYLINGVGFNKTSAAASLFPSSIGTAAAPVTGTVLVRMVNAGLRMHVPSIVGSSTTPTSTAPTVGGFSLIAEDGNALPGLIPRVQSEVFMAAGKTYDVMINVPAAGGTALPVYDRELSLSGNSIVRDAGMLAYIGVNGAGLPASAALGAAKANNDSYSGWINAGQTFTVSDVSKGVLANDINVFGVQVITQPAQGTLTLNANGTFTYVAGAGYLGNVGDSFTYCGNGATSGATCATVTLGGNPAAKEPASGISVNNISYTATEATYLKIAPPGVLSVDSDAAGNPLTVAVSSLKPSAGLTVTMDPNGGFNASVAAAGTYTFTYQAQNSQGTLSTNPATVTLSFPAPANLTVQVLDGSDKTTTISDYRWVIEEDRTFYINPNCVQNPPPTGCPTAANGIVPTLGVNFHTSYMPYVAQGCTGQLSCESGQMVFNPATGTHVPTVCNIGNGVCDVTSGATQQTAVLPSQVVLDPTKRYYISVLPGDSANPFAAGGYTGPPDCTAAGHCGHGMGGAPIPAAVTCASTTTGGVTTTACTAPATGATCTPAAGSATCVPAGTVIPPVTVLTQPSPYPTAHLSVFVFEDDFPLNGEQDGGGGVDVLSPVEPGLGGFQIHLWDAMGGNGDFTGQMSYDMFNQPLGNSLDGTIDPVTGLNACPITQQGQGITGMIVTCPKYESDNQTLSPLAGQAVIANLMPGRFGVIATPAADRIARGEEWLQTNTLDGQKAHDSFARIGEPNYFQEFGPAGFHVTIGFANPAIINARKQALCNGTDASSPQPGTPYNCNNTITGKITGQRLSRTPDERLYESGSRDTYAWTQCYVSFGDADGEDFAFTKCNADGTFTLSGLPDGDWRITTFDQWNDQLVDGLSTPVRLSAGTTPTTTNLGNIAATQWQTNLYTRTFIDDNQDGISQSDETGIPFANVAVRLRDGSLENFLTTDFTGATSFNETFPLFSWYTVETDVTRYKNTGTHVVYDAGGPADGTLTTCGGTLSGTGYPPCGTSTIGRNLANTVEQVSVPLNLRVPGSVYCATADCSGYSIATGPAAGTGASSGAPPSACTTDSTGATTCTTKLSTGRIDSPWLGGVEGWQGFPGQNNFLEFGKEPYVAGENGGIKGHVVYASTRPFDDPQMLVQTQWEPLIPHVTINLYQEGFAADGVTPTLTLVDHTQTSSWDDWAQGFHLAADGVTKIPNMNCPGQGNTSGAVPDLFYFSLYNQPQYLDFYNNAQHGTAGATALPNNSQFKCYDGMHNWNQLQPAPYDGMYQFPSVTATDPVSGRPTRTNCTICYNKDNTHVPNLPPTDLYYGLPQLPPGKYVVEVVPPPGFELVKEEDKNILIGDDFIAPATQQFGGLGNVFILPDQASVATAYNSGGSGYNANNAQNPTQSFGANPNNGIVPSFVPEPTWPCVGQARIVPDYISLYPQTTQVSPFAGATRNLCDRKEVTLTDQVAAIAKFYLFTSTHIASKFTGGITDDYTSEFDPFSPQFGEKFAPPDLPVSVKDWAGNETNRVYADHWGAYNGMTYSTWEVNPPNPTGYSPTMMVVCMNDPGPIPGPNGTMITDPLFTQGYSQFCYELPFMPGTTQYLDTPVVPTSAFAGAGYNNVDCAYPDTTPAISEVDGDGVGPWVSAAGHPLTINALGDQMVPNYAYSGPSANTAPFNQKTIKRHYGFGTPQGSGKVTIGGVTATVTSWSDTQIKVTVPSGVPNCAIQQQTQYGGSAAQCGQLVITAGNGKQSIDSVTVTIGGKLPTHVPAWGSIQAAIDAAAPGDLIMIDPTCNATIAATGAIAPVACDASLPTGQTLSTTSAAHNELVLMWKPVRLQGVGSASSVINANTHPAGKLDPWRRAVDCLFGLATDGQPASTTNPYDSTFNCPYGSNASTGGPVGPDGNPWNYFAGTAATVLNGTVTTYGSPQVDRLPLEAVVGWDASQNGNLAEQLQEPSLMGALEGAGITVLGKGLRFPGGQDPFGSGAATAGAFPTGTTLLTGNLNGSGNLVVGDSNSLCHTSKTVAGNPYPSNFVCNPSSIDGLTITDSSQGGGGIFVHGWGHYLQIANNRIVNNAGTLSGGINLGQGEFPPSYIKGGTTNAPPGSCQSSGEAGIQLPYCHNVDVNVHNNNVSLNSSTGDELFSATPAGAGGASFCTGTDYYKFNFNWVCGNLSSGDGGGFGHLGFSYNGDIEHNTFIFNQSTNPTIPANGGGLIIMGSPDADPTCGATTDLDCVPTPASITPSDGVGPNLVINANLIMGNAAESGTGGGIAFQSVNGSDVLAFPTRPQQWYSPSVTNNIIVDNVAGWDGAGISLEDTLNIDIVNNTIASNVTTASAGPLFNTIGAPLASQQGGPHGPNCTANCGSTSAPQVSGLVSLQNSAVLAANIALLPVVGGGAGAHRIKCPTGHYAGANPNDGSCLNVSYPLLYNDLFWQNSAYNIGVGASFSTQYQQNIISLYEAGTKTLAPNQTVSGQCPALPASSYWDIGVRGDTGPTDHHSGVTLAPTHSVLTSTAGYGATNFGGNPAFVAQYCDGSRQPPEACTANGCGWAVPAGISDATVPNPIFNLTPVATVDEGNNWVNMRWGPLSLTNPTVVGADGNYGGGAALGNYALAGTGSSAYNEGVATFSGVAAPTTDFFGTTRPQAGVYDIGAVEFVTGGGGASATVSPTTLAFGNWFTGTTSGVTAVTVTNTGSVALAGGTFTFGGGTPQPFSRVTTGAFPAGAPNCGAGLAVGASCTIKVHFVAPGTAGQFTRNLTVAYTGVVVTGSPVTLTGSSVTTRAAVGITPSSLTITLPSGAITGSGVVTLTNTSPAGGTSTSISGVAINGSGGGLIPPWFFSGTFPSTDTCTGTALAPGQSCTVGVEFTNLFATRGVNRAGTITFTDSATGSPQTGNLIGFATP